MVTKIKPYRIRDVNEPEEGNSLQYNDPNTFARGEGGGGGGEYTAGEGISIGQGLDYSAMRGPCDEGFHVPSYDECNFILRVTSGQYGQTPGNLIKAPSNGYIRFTNSGSYDVGFTMWTRVDQGLNQNEAYLFCYDYDDSQGGHKQPLTLRPKSIGAGVRGFADIPVEADETWDVLYDKTRGTIYRNETLGLISVYSKETNNWVTLQDKNVGAENVGDNGYYFQWGNNYGFTSASEATSSEKVDASGYAPSTYNEPPINTRGDWSSVRNSDLWGGVTGAVTIDNVITNTGVLSVNGETGHVTVESGGKQSFFKTQDEYDALPASKESDGNLYIIVDTHKILEYSELILLTPDEIVAELNSASQKYINKYAQEGHILYYMGTYSLLEGPETSTKVDGYTFSTIGNDSLEWEKNYR